VAWSLDREDFGRTAHAAEPDGVARAGSVNRTAEVGDPADATDPFPHPIEIHPEGENPIRRRIDGD
jgi:hypothetical protein